MEITPLEKFSFIIKMLFITVLAGILIAIIAGVLIYNRQPSVRLLNERQKALELEAAGDFEGAESVMLAANERYPGFPVSQETLAGIYLDWGAALLRSGTAEGFAAGLEKFQAALEQQDAPQIRDSAVRVILEVLPAETDAADADSAQEYEEKLERLAAAKEVFDDSRLGEREEAVLSAWLKDLLQTRGDKKTVEFMQERLEADPGNAAAASAFMEACAVFASNRRRAVTEENEPVEIYREMNQAVYFLHRWAVRLAELSVEAGQDSEAGQRLGVQALTLEGLANEYDIERAGLIVKSEERIAEKEAAEAAALAATSKASFLAFCLQHPDQGLTQFAVARGIQEHSGFGRNSSVYQVRSGINDEHAQTWLAQRNRADGSYEQLLYVVDLEDRSFRQIQYRYTENGEEKQEERSTEPFSFMPYYNEDAFHAMIGGVSDKLITALPGMIGGKDAEESSPELTEEDLWISFRYYTDGTSVDGETTVSGLAYYRAGCILEDRYHEFIVMDGGDGELNIREVEPSG